MTSEPMKSTSNESVMEAPGFRAFPWLHLAWFGALLCLCYFPIIRNTINEWKPRGDMSHGIFVPLIAAYVVWDRRGDLMSLPVSRCRWGLILVAWGAVQVCLGALAAELFTQRVALLISAAGLLLYFAGPRVLRALAFPLFLLLFMLPIPGVLYKQITFPLQLLASRIAEIALDLMHVLVVREGNILELGSTSLSVAEACSGIRALLSLTFFSLAYGYLVCNRLWVRWALLILAVPVAVLANAIRVILTALVSRYDPALAEGFLHGFSGWVIFVVAITLLIGLERILRRIG